MSEELETGAVFMLVIGKKYVRNIPRDLSWGLGIPGVDCLLESEGVTKISAPYRGLDTESELKRTFGVTFPETIELGAVKELFAGLKAVEMVRMPRISRIQFAGQL